MKRRSVCLLGLGLPAWARAQRGFDKRPPAGPARPEVWPSLSETRLANGLRVGVAEQSGSPLLALRLYSLGASPLGSGCMHWLTRGAWRNGEAMDAADLAYQAELLGDSLQWGASPAGCYIGLRLKSDLLDDGLALLLDIASKPLLAPATLPDGLRLAPAQAWLRQRWRPQLGALVMAGAPSSAAAHATAQTEAAVWSAPRSPSAAAPISPITPLEALARAKAQGAPDLATGLAMAEGEWARSLEDVQALTELMAQALIQGPLQALKHLPEAWRACTPTQWQAWPQAARPPG